MKNTQIFKKQSSTKRTPGARSGVVVSCVLFSCALVLLCSSIANAADIYYSVGTDNSDLKTASTVTITGGTTAAFSVGQPDNVGIGDRITYNTSSVAYIVSRSSSTQFTVSTATGGTLTNGGPWTVNTIERTFHSLNNAVNTAASPNPSDAAYLDTTDLTSGPYTLHIVCYGDANADTTNANVSGWVTDTTSYIHILPSNEARNKGRWDAAGYRLQIANGDAITVSDDNVRISGIQIVLSASADDGIVSVAGNENVSISDNIIYYSGANPSDSSGISIGDSGTDNTVAKVWNNIIYDFLGTNNSGILVNFAGNNSKAYVYNNTVYNNTTGINDASGTSSIVAKNNLSYWNGDNYGGSGTFDASSSHNLSGPNTDAQIPGTNAQNGEAVQFIDVASDDFRIAAVDAAAQGTGVNLSTDANLNFTTDIEGQRRDHLWDIGADERTTRILNVISDTNPIVLQLGDGRVAEDVQITFTDGANGLDIIKKGGSGTTWGSDLISSGTLFTTGGESGVTQHSVLSRGISEVIIRKERTGVVSHYHVYPSGRIVLDAAGATSITVNQTSTFTEYSDGISHAGGYHAYVDLLETAASSSSDYTTPDVPNIITGTRVTDRTFDYANDGFEEGRGSYPIIASSGNAVVDFNGNSQTRYHPVILLEEFYPKTQPSASMILYWDGTDTTASGEETWAGPLTSGLSTSTGIRGSAQTNDSAGDYASVQTTSNIGDPGTLSLWVRSSSVDNPSANEYIFFADTDMNLYFDNSGYLNFRINSGVDLTYSSDIYDNNWHKIVCAWDYTVDEYALYVDGKPRATNTTSYTAPTFDASMIFTAEDNSGTSRFAGDIDEVRIYDGVVKPTGRVLFHSRMDAASDITSPQVGTGGTVEGTTSFAAGVRGNAVDFDAAGEYATIPSSGNITASEGTLEMWIKSDSAGVPSSAEQLFFGDADFNIFFNTSGQISFEISNGVNLTDTTDTYDGLWHHVKGMWDYTNDQYFLYVDGKQVVSSMAAYTAPSIDATMYLGAADAADTNRYNGLIDELFIYDKMVFPYGAFHIPVSWGDSNGLSDPTVLLYWDADSSTLNIGSGSATLGGSIAAGAGIHGSGIVNDSIGEYVSFPSASNIANDEGSLAFWVKSGDTSPSGTEYLFYAQTNFNVFFDSSGFVNFNISNGVNLQHAEDIYDAKWHYIRCTWDYTNDRYELFVDGLKRVSNTNSYTAPTLDANVFVTAQNVSGTNRFDGSLDELIITNSRSTSVTSTAYGIPVMQPQVGMPLSYRIDIGDNLSGLASDELLTPGSDFISSVTNSPSEYSLEYLGNITTAGRPSIAAISVTQNANTNTVTINYTGTDPDNDTVTYVAADCEYSLNSTDGSDGTWNVMTTSETTEAFTSSGAALSFIWDADSDTSVYDGTVYARLKVKDGIGHESVSVTSPVFSVDTAAPSGLGSFIVSGKATTMMTLTWDAVSDDNWVNNAHYEIWYGTDQSDVQDRIGTASEWDDSNDTDLDSRGAGTTTITNLTADTTYFFKIWAIDGFGNESTVADISDATSESVISRVYRVQIDPIYDEANDAILITTSLLTRSGTIVTDLTDITLTYVGVLDNTGKLLSGNLNGEDDTISGTTNAIFYTTWAPEDEDGLTANTTYTIISKVNYNGELYSGVKGFNVNELGDVTQQISDVNTKVNILQTTTTSLGLGIDSFTDKVDEHVESQTTQRDNRQRELTSFESEVGSIEEDTSANLTGLIEEELSQETAKGTQTEIITRPTTVATGSTVPIRLRGETGLSPTITVYDPRNVTRISSSPMQEVGTTGIYSYDVTFNSTWGLGEFTILVQEATKQSTDSVLMTVVQSGSTGGGGGSASSSSTITTDLVYSRLNNMDGDITSLVENMGTVGLMTADVSGSIDQLINGLDVARNTGPMDAQTMSEIVSSIGVAVGQDGDGSGTILGQISDLQGMLVGIGADAAIASSLVETSEVKAKAIREASSKIQKLLEEGNLEEAEEELLSVGEKLVELREGMAGLPSTVTTDSMSREIQTTIDEINRIAAEKGIENLIPPLESVEGGMAMDPEDIIEVRNNVNEVKSLMDEVRSFLDQEINKPIVHSWFEGD